MKEQVLKYCSEPFSLAAVDDNDDLVGFQLARKTCWLDDVYIHLTYAGVKPSAGGMKVFKRLIDKEKQNRLPLVAEVKPDNGSDMAARLMHYNFRLYTNAHTDSGCTYRWDAD